MNYLLIGAISGCLVVALGAFGAHALKEILDDHGKSIYNKAILYHMFHSIALLILGLINKIQPEISLSISIKSQFRIKERVFPVEDFPDPIIPIRYS